MRRGDVLPREDEEHAVGECRHPEGRADGEERHEAEVWSLVRNRPYGDVADREASRTHEGEEDELGAGQCGVDPSVHDARHDDGHEAHDDEQGKVAHKFS